MRELIIALLNEQQQQQQAITVPTTISRESRLNSTTGINITDEEFIRMMNDKVVNKKKKGSTNKTKRFNKAFMRPKNAKQASTIGINIGKDDHMDNDKENDDFMKYEFAVRQNLDLEIQEASRVIDSNSIVL